MSSVVENKIEIEIQGFLVMCFTYCCTQHSRQNHDSVAHRPHNYTLYDIPPIRTVFQVTQMDPRSSLMMADR
jgi:hypothetical protein